MNINTGRNDAITKIDVVEKKYNAKWVGQLPLKTADGQWANFSADIYYQKTPPVAGYSKYFALYLQNDKLYITSGESAVEGIITGVVAKDGEIVYSRYRHDMHHSTDMTVWIDGGRDYTRYSVAKTVNLAVFDGEFQEVI